MTDRPAFEHFFKTELLPVLRPLEEQRLALVKKIIITGGLIAAAGLLLAAFLIANSVDLRILLFPAVGGFALGAFLIKRMSSEYIFGFKTLIVEPVIQYVSPGLTYVPASGIPEIRFIASGIFRHRIDRFRHEDLIQGTVGKTPIKFCELHAEYKTGGKNQTWKTIFKGQFFIADFNKHFKGRTFVLPDTAEQMLGRFGQKLQEIGKSHGELVQLEDPEFEREFAAYSTDQVEARYILSPSLMRRMLEFKNKTGEKVYFSFTGGEVNIGISSAKNRFEPRLFSTVLDVDLVREFVADLQMALDVVDDLNLNTRIWTKK